MKRLVFFAFLLAAFVMKPLNSFGAYIFVGKTENYQYHSIWDGLQAAAYGDIVVVYAGTYDEGNMTVHEGRTVRFYEYDNIKVNFQSGAKLDVEESATLLADMNSRTLVFQCPSGQWTGVALHRNCTANLDGIDIKDAYIGLDIINCTLTMGSVYIL